uniref:hypothetical protein n=1 Tax=Natrinema hispanicum TaxID=392421 RepID=UPI001F5F6B9D|nr:hypothetical protein [Natrinema hispanicum]
MGADRLESTGRRELQVGNAEREQWHDTDDRGDRSAEKVQRQEIRRPTTEDSNDGGNEI